MRGSELALRPSGWAGQRPAHASRRAGSCDHWRYLQWQRRRQRSISVGRGPTLRASVTRSSPSGRPDRMLWAAGAACGATLVPSVQLQPPGAPSAEKTTRRPTIGLPWRGAASSGAMHAHTRWPSAGTVRDHTPPRLTCAW